MKYFKIIAPILIIVLVIVIIFFISTYKRDPCIDSADQDYCYYTQSSIGNDYCYKINNSEIKSGCDNKEWLNQYCFVEKTRNQNFECYSKLSLENNDTNYCIFTNYTRCLDTYYNTKKPKELCGTNQTCIVEFAMYKKDINICNLIPLVGKADIAFEPRSRCIFSVNLTINKNE